MGSISTRSLEELGVRDIAAAIAKAELRPSDLLDAVLERIRALEPKVHAWSYLDVEGARAQAEALTTEATAGKLRGPLHGVPIGIKDEFHVEGMPTGMRGLDAPPLEREDATCVARLRGAGAIILGKTYMPVGGKTPPTRNPWNLEHTPGGTSSGSGAAVGARMVPVAIGEQTMGSNLRPAAYCGIAGIKPSYGRVSRFGCLPFAWSLDHVSIIGLSVADMALVLSVIAGPDPRDATTLPDPAPAADLALDALRPPRVGVVRNFFPERAQPEMQEAVERVAARLKEAGAEVTDFFLPAEFALSWPADRLVSGAEGSTFHAVELEERDLTGSAGRLGTLIPASYYLEARRIRSWLRARVQGSLGDLNAVLMPATPGPAPKGQGTGESSLLVPWSFLGFPAMTIPCGLSEDGLPLGLQLVAGPRADYELLQTGAWCEGTLGRLPAPPIADQGS